MGVVTVDSPLTFRYSPSSTQIFQQNLQTRNYHRLDRVFSGGLCPPNLDDDFVTLAPNLVTNGDYQWDYPIGTNNAHVTPYALLNWYANITGSSLFNIGIGLNGTVYGKDFSIIDIVATFGATGIDHFFAGVWFFIYIYNPITECYFVFDIYSNYWGLTTFDSQSGGYCNSKPIKILTPAPWHPSLTLLDLTFYYGIPYIASLPIEISVGGSMSFGYAAKVVTDANNIPLLLTAPLDIPPETIQFEITIGTSLQASVTVSAFAQIFVASAGISAHLVFVNIVTNETLGHNLGYSKFCNGLAVSSTFLQGSVDVWYAYKYPCWRGWLPGLCENRKTFHLFSWPGWTFSQNALSSSCCEGEGNGDDTMDRDHITDPQMSGYIRTIGEPSDTAGHIIPNFCGGQNDDTRNFFPQTAFANNEFQNSFESRISNYPQQNQFVSMDLRVTFQYSGSRTRPSNLDVGNVL